jgi:uncharacterized protein
MQPSMFNVRVPLRDRDDVFLMNTFTDAQLVVSRDVVNLLDQLGAAGAGSTRALTADEQAALDTLAANGFVVSDRETERENLHRYFHELRDNTKTLRVTVLTTLQCNFACDYCIQGDHGDYNKHAHKMSLADAARLADWIEARLDTLGSDTLSLTFFGGEPLLNLPVMYYLAERMWQATQARGVRQWVNIITNGLLLTREIVDRLNPLGLNGIKITLDGDRDTHDRMRPLRGGQGTFDRIIRNIRDVADRTKISIGGNFDADSVESYPALLDFLQQQEFAGVLAKVNFKPVIRAPQPSAPVAQPVGKGKKKSIPLTLVGTDNKPLGGSCMTAAGSGSKSGGSASAAKAASICDTCQFNDEKMSFLREETRKHGFATSDGVHMGPCELHHKHAYTVGPEGSLFACPGFAGDATMSVGHIDGRADAAREAMASDFDALAAWTQCGDCAFIPVCGGGCAVASHTEQGDKHRPSCHKPSFEAGLESLAHRAVA